MKIVKLNTYFSNKTDKLINEINSMDEKDLLNKSHSYKNKSYLMYLAGFSIIFIIVLFVYILN